MQTKPLLKRKTATTAALTAALIAAGILAILPPAERDRKIAQGLAATHVAMAALTSATPVPHERPSYLASFAERAFRPIVTAASHPALDPYELRIFKQRVRSRLPRYLPWIEEASALTGLPWTVLAAVGYQESHWDPEATSPTGVRGFMMLTKGTASDLRVADRLDPRQSIDGGARYLAKRLDQVPRGVPAEDRLWFALAAYNMGIGHMYDARALAEKRGLDKNRWQDVEKVLPLLEQSKYYNELRYGRARGTEARTYVRRIKAYLDLLESADI